MAKKSKDREAGRKSRKAAGEKTASGTTRIGTPREPSALGRWWNRLDEPARRQVRARLIWAVLALTAAPFAVVGLHRLEQKILAGQSGPITRGFVVRLQGVPEWMPQSTIAEIEAALTPPTQFNDASLARQVYERAVADPWIAQVRIVRKHRGQDAGPGIVTVEADFRRPYASISWLDSRGETFECYCDPTGVLLPDRQVPKAAVDGCYTTSVPVAANGVVRPVPYITVYGLQQPPPAMGRRWEGDDLQAALGVIELLQQRPYYDQIRIVDVSNYMGRRNSQASEIVLVAQQGQSGPTYINFGRLPRINGDYVIAPDRVMGNLDSIYRANGGTLLGLGLVDLRFDPPRPTPEDVARARR